MKQLGGSDSRDGRRANARLPEKGRHVKFSPFVRNENRGVEDQSHAGLRGGRDARARSRSLAKASASSGESRGIFSQRPASSSQVPAGCGNGITLATGRPSRTKVAGSRRLSTRSSTRRKSLTASATGMAFSLMAGSYRKNRKPATAKEPATFGAGRIARRRSVGRINRPLLQLKIKL